MQHYCGICSITILPKHFPQTKWRIDHVVHLLSINFYMISNESIMFKTLSLSRIFSTQIGNFEIYSIGKLIEIKTLNMALNSMQH